MRLSVLLSFLSMYLPFYLSICLIEWAVAQVPPTPFYVGLGVDVPQPFSRTAVSV